MLEHMRKTLFIHEQWFQFLTKTVGEEPLLHIVGWCFAPWHYFEGGTHCKVEQSFDVHNGYNG